MVPGGRWSGKRGQVGEAVREGRRTETDHRAVREGDPASTGLFGEAVAVGNWGIIGRQRHARHRIEVKAFAVQVSTPKPPTVEAVRHTGDFTRVSLEGQNYLLACRVPYRERAVSASAGDAIA